MLPKMLRGKLIRLERIENSGVGEHSYTVTSLYILFYTVSI